MTSMADALCITSDKMSYSRTIPVDVQYSSLRWRCKRTVCQSAVSLFLGCFKQKALSLEVAQLLRKPPSLPWTSLIFAMSFCLYLCPSISVSPPRLHSISPRELIAWMRCFFFFSFLLGKRCLSLPGSMCESWGRTAWQQLGMEY